MLGAFKFGSIRHEFQKVVSGSVRIVSFSISVIHILTLTYPFPPHPNPLIRPPLSSTHLHSYPHLQFKPISIGALSRLSLKILIWNWLYMIQFFLNPTRVSFKNLVRKAKVWKKFKKCIEENISKKSTGNSMWNSCWKTSFYQFPRTKENASSSFLRFVPLLVEDNSFDRSK